MSDDEWTHPIEEADVEPINFKKELQQVLKDDEHVGSHQEPDISTFRASSTGYCPRQILLNKMGVKAPDPSGLGRFQVGDWIHEWIQENVLPKYMSKHENEVTYSQDGITLKGHYDAFDGDVVYDFKSRSSWYRFSSSLPIQRHLDQLNTYMAALGIDYGMMVYVSKGDLSVEQYPDYFGEGEEHSSPEQHLIQYSQKRMDEIIEKCQTVRDFLDEEGFPEDASEIPFDKCGEDKSDMCIGCSFEGSDEKDFSRFWDNYNQESEGDDSFTFRR